MARTLRRLGRAITEAGIPIVARAPRTETIRVHRTCRRFETHRRFAPCNGRARSRAAGAAGWPTKSVRAPSPPAIGSADDAMRHVRATDIVLKDLRKGTTHSIVGCAQNKRTEKIMRNIPETGNGVLLRERLPRPRGIGNIPHVVSADTGRRIGRERAHRVSGHHFV